MQIIRNIWMMIVSPPSSEALAKRELENAKRSYLENKTHAEYYTTLCTFDTQRITRLAKYLEIDGE